MAKRKRIRTRKKKKSSRDSPSSSSSATTIVPSSTTATTAATTTPVPNPTVPNSGFVSSWQALTGGNPGMIHDPRMFYISQSDGRVVGLTPVVPGAFFYPNFSNPSFSIPPIIPDQDVVQQSETHGKKRERDDESRKREDDNDPGKEGGASKESGGSQTALVSQRKKHKISPEGKAEKGVAEIETKEISVEEEKAYDIVDELNRLCQTFRRKLKMDEIVSDEVELSARSLLDQLRLIANALPDIKDNKIVTMIHDVKNNQIFERVEELDDTPAEKQDQQIAETGSEESIENPPTKRRRLNIVRPGDAGYADALAACKPPREERLPMDVSRFRKMPTIWFGRKAVTIGVIDTNCLLHHQVEISELRSYPHVLIKIPLAVVRELDHLKASKDPSVSRDARRAINLVLNFVEGFNSNFQLQKTSEVIETVGEFQSINNDERIVKACLYYKVALSNRVILVSDDSNILLKAGVFGVSHLSLDAFMATAREEARKLSIQQSSIPPKQLPISSGASDTDVVRNSVQTEKAGRKRKDSKSGSRKLDARFELLRKLKELKTRQKDVEKKKTKKKCEKKSESKRDTDVSTAPEVITLDDDSDTEHQPAGYSNVGNVDQHVDCSANQQQPVYYIY